MAHSYQDLVVWQCAMELVTEVCLASKTFPKHETYGLSDQLRRVAFSIPSNIAKGQGRGTKRGFLHFFTVARGSLLELETQVLIAEKLRYLSPVAAAQILIRSGRVLRLLNAFLASLGERSIGRMRSLKTRTEAQNAVPIWYANPTFS
jgi:four helix bundle protein